MSKKRKGGSTGSSASGNDSSAKGANRGGAARHQPQTTSSTSTYVMVGAAIVVIVALIGGGIWWNQRDLGPVDEQVLNSNAALIVGAPDAATTIDVFEDMLCPSCKEFEERSGQSIQAAVDDGTLRVRYHLLTFLDGESASGDYSSRAAGALQCVGDAEDRAVFAAYHAELFRVQPSQGGDSDLSNERLAEIAAAQGAGEQAQQCVADGAQVTAAQASAEESQIQLNKATGGTVGTPTVVSAGDPVDGIFEGSEWLDDLLAEAAG